MIFVWGHKVVIARFSNLWF